MTALRATHDGFDLVRIDNRLNLRIICSSCNKHAFVTSKGERIANCSEFVSRRFTAIGWSVGKNRGRDLCPDCAHPRQMPVPKPTLEVTPVRLATNTYDVDAALDKLSQPLPAVEKAAAEAPVKERKKAVIMTKREMFRMHALLDEHLEKHDDKLYKYKEGWSDEKIAAAVSPLLNVEHTRTLRRDMFGNLYQDYSGRGKNFVAANEMRKLLPKRMDELETLVLELSERVARLEEITTGGNR